MENQFIELCRCGKLEDAKQIVNENPDCKFDFGLAFHLACELGHLEVAKWLRFMKNNEIHDDSLRFTFRETCLKGNLEVVKWLYQIANENEIEMDSIISDNKEYIFRWSCKNGHLKVAQWLYQIKPDIDIFAKNDWAFRECCCDSRLELVEWLQSLFPEKYSFQRENGRINYQVMKAKRTIQNTITMEKEQIVKCAICDENLSDVQTSCKHLFCEDCITTWLETKSSCPYCRQEINYDNLCKIYFKV